MIILYDVILGNIRMIIFQLVFEVLGVLKSLKKALRRILDMVAFSYQAILSRHDKPSRLTSCGDN